MGENQPKLLPTIVGNDVFSVAGRFQGADHAIDETEILQLPTEFRPHPKRSDSSAMVLENEQSTAHFPMKPCFFDDSDHRVDASVAVDVAHLKLIDRIGQIPSVAGGIGRENEPTQAVAHRFQAECLRFNPQADRQNPSRHQNPLHPSKMLQQRSNFRVKVLDLHVALV